MNTELGEFIRNLEIIDSHEHLAGCEADYLALDHDILQEILCVYTLSDLISAGMKEEHHKAALDKNNPLPERWAFIEPFWEHVKHTGYGQMVQEGINDLLGTKLGDDPIQDINEHFRELISGHPYQEIIKGKCKIKTALLDKMVPYEESGARVNIIDSNLEVDSQLFKCVYHLDDFIFPQTFQDLYFLEDRFNISISSIDDWANCCYKSCQKAIEKGVVGFKLALAYKRSLDFQYTPKAEAEKAFQNVIANKIDVKWEPRAMGVDDSFQNYMMFEILNIVKEIDLPLQIHTGLQAGNANYLTWANPMLLNQFFIQYPSVKFILLHMGIPFQQEAAMLAKMFPNVFLDACWTHVISPQATVNAMQEWIESLPINKVIAFGGDLPSLLCLYGNQKIARNNLNKALQNKIADDVLDVKEAMTIARAWLFENPKNIFNL